MKINKLMGDLLGAMQVIKTDAKSVKHLMESNTLFDNVPQVISQSCNSATASSRSMRCILQPCQSSAAIVALLVLVQKRNIPEPSASAILRHNRPSL